MSPLCDSSERLRSRHHPSGCGALSPEVTAQPLSLENAPSAVGRQPGGQGNSGFCHPCVWRKM